MKRGFTLIETVYVILIIGVLAVFALPLFLGMKDGAIAQVAFSFAATLTRTTGNSLWSKSIASGDHGSIKADDDGDSSKFYGRSLEAYVTIPKYFDKTSINFNNCVRDGESASPFIQKNSSAGGEYNIFCRDGNETDAPKFVASKESSYNF